MLKNNVVLACFAISVAPLVFTPSDGKETKLPDIRPDVPMLVDEAPLFESRLDPGPFGQLPEDASLPTFDPNSTLQEQATILARVIRRGGKPGFSALLQGLRLSGIEIASPANTWAPAPGRNQGLVLSLTMLQMFASQAATHSLAPFSDFMTGAAGYLNQPDVDGLSRAFLESVQKMLRSPNQGLQFYALLVSALAGQPGAATLLSPPAKDLASLMVSPIQMSLLGMRLAAENRALHPEVEGAPTLGWSGFLRRFSFVSSDCLQKAGETVKDAQVVKSDTAFEEVLTFTGKDSADSSEQGIRNADRLANFLRLNPGALKVIDFLVSGGARERLPLIRTKTTEKGERKTLFLEFVPSFLENEYTQCLNELTKALDLKVVKDLKDPSFFENVEVKVELGKVFNKNRVVFNAFGNAHEVVAKKPLNKKGVVEFPIFGAPQETNLPANFKPHMLSVPVTVEYEAPVVQFFEPTGTKDGEAALHGLLALDRANQGKRRETWGLSVQDWIGRAEGKVTARATANFHKSTQKVTADRSEKTKTDFDMDVFNDIQILPTSEIIPPVSFPGAPPQFQLPQLAARYTLSAVATHAFSRTENVKTRCWDPCDPAVKGEEKSEKSGQLSYTGTGSDLKAGRSFAGPWSIDTKAKLIKFQMMIYVLNKVGSVHAGESQTECDGSPNPNNKPPVDLPITGPYELFKTLNLEVPFTIDGAMAVVDQTLMKDYGHTVILAIPGKSTAIVVPATLEIHVEARLPLP